MNNKKKMQIIFPYSRVKQNASVYLYGAGQVGKILAQQIEKNNYCEIKGFVDKNVDKIKYSKLECISIEELRNRKFDYVVVSVLNDLGIKSDLLRNGISEEKIILLNSQDIIESDEGGKYQISSTNYFLPEHLVYKKIDLNMTVDKILENRGMRDLSHNRVKNISTSLDELLITSIKMKRTKFWIIDNEKVFLGEIELDDEYTSLNLKQNSLISEFLFLSTVIYTTDTIEEASKKLYYLSYDEFPVLDDNGRLVGIYNRMNYYMAICDIKTDEKEPILSRGYCHDKQRFGLWSKYEGNINSQTGEDGIIDEIFSRIGFVSRYCVEFGAWNGVYLSNTKNLIDKYDFRALFIEGDAKKAQDGIRNYEDKAQTVHYAIGYVQHRNGKLLDDFLKEDNAPYDIDLLSIDIDGYDYHVWKSLTNYRPRVVIIEYNSYTPNNIIEIPPLDETQSVGASALALVELAISKGYSLVAVTKFNLLFVVDEEYEKLKLPYNDLNLLNMKEADYDNSWFQSFQGGLYNTGRVDSYELLGIPFESNKFCVRRDVN